VNTKGVYVLEVAARPKRTDRHLVCYDKRPDPSKSFTEPVGYCGYARLRMDGPRLSIEYRDENDQLMLGEDWNRDAAGLVTGAVRPGEVDLQLTDPRGLDALVLP
jgi:hypothetical protein